MAKSRIKPVKSGKGIRMSFSRQREVLDMPNLIEVQKNSYNWFIEKGLKEVFDDISPIENSTGTLKLEFTGFNREKPKYTIEECKERDATYAAPLKVGVRLLYKSDENADPEILDTGSPEIYMGELPVMTATG